MKKFVQLVLLIIIVALGVTVWDGFYVLEEESRRSSPSSARRWAALSPRPA